ncbi:cation transporter [Pseudoduganella aquatica]|uniref:cation transporter n=1 Tax=Pseudoduganella aquatica TaxID=2660641 RepID=UPI001E41603C|nr:cation transporter [Pseudoduganella aquatica]
MAGNSSLVGYRRGAIRLAWMLTAMVTLAEMVAWVVTDSLAMLAGAVHLSLDLVLSLRSMRVPRAIKASGSLHARCYNAIKAVFSFTLFGLLLLAFFAVLLRGPHRLLHPFAVEGEALLWVAAGGLVASLICAYCTATSSRYAAWSLWLGNICALALCVLALLLITVHPHWLDAAVAILTMVLLFPRLFLAAYHH